MTAAEREALRKERAEFLREFLRERKDHLLKRGWIEWETPQLMMMAARRALAMKGNKNASL